MDEQTALVLALQLVALFSIAGALLAYLLCKIKPGSDTAISTSIPGAGKPVLVTSCDTALGLQIALHLADKGFRVFAGLRDGAAAGAGVSSDSLPSRIIRSWQKQKESETQEMTPGIIIPLPFDVNREDILHEAVDIVRAHLPAGEDGIWSLINTSGVSYKGRLDQQDITHWDAMLKSSLIGLLRTTRTFQGLLKNSNGRILAFGALNRYTPGLVAYTASRYAIEGACNALRQELGVSGIRVITLNPTDISPEILHAAPRMKDSENGLSLDVAGCVQHQYQYQYQPTVLSPSALQTLEIALTASVPKPNYNLAAKSAWWSSNVAKCLNAVR